MAKRKGDCIHFNSHTDVVELGQDWTRDPFGGELDGDKIYGRGSCDMKGGLAASIICMLKPSSTRSPNLRGPSKYLAQRMRKQVALVALLIWQKKVSLLQPACNTLSSPNH